MPKLCLAAFAAALLAVPTSAQTLDAYSRPEARQQVPFDAQTRAVSTEALQSTLYELIALQHATHQAHWNVVGQNFYSLHDMLGEIYQQIFGYIDTIAERKRALGESADGDPARVAAGANLPAYPTGLQQDYDVPAQLSDRFYTVAQRVEDRIQETGDAGDLSTQDALIGVARGLELDLWKLRALQLGAPAGR